MSAIVTGTAIRQLERPASQNETVTEQDVGDASKLARLLMRLMKDVSDLKRRHWPRRLDYEDLAVTSGDALRCEHGLGGRVRWWIVDWIPATPGDVPLFERSGDTDASTLVLDVGNSGLVTVRIEEAG